MRMIELTKVTPINRYNDTDEPGENATANAGVSTMVNIEAIRCFYPRRDNQPGTRLTFLDGGGFVVSQPYDEVKALIGV